MKKLILLFPLLALAVEAPAPIPVSPALQQTLRDINAQMVLLNTQADALNLQRENVRLASCLEAGVTKAECGQIAQSSGRDGAFPTYFVERIKQEAK